MSVADPIQGGGEKRTLFFIDDTEVSVVGDTSTEKKSFNMPKHRELHRISILHFITEIKVDAGTGKLEIYIDGESTPRHTEEFTNTFYDLRYFQIDVSDIEFGLMNAGLNIFNTGANNTTSHRHLWVLGEQ